MTTTQLNKPSSGQQTEGERLERELWEAMKTRNYSLVEQRISPDFQSTHLDGARNRGQELELLKRLDLGSYTLSNFKAYEHGDTITVTYLTAAEETIDNKRLSGKASPRLSVWKKNKNGEWQWIAHANLRSLA